MADVERALAGVRAGLVEDAAASSRTDDAVAVLDVGGSTVTVPRDASEGVKLAVGDAVVGISLPASEGGEAGVSLESGAVAYPSDNGVANTVVPFSDGVQMLTTIASSKAPERFAYGIDVPVGGSVMLVEDGSAVVADRDGITVITTNVPWAVDANGAAVPTRYEVDGTQLVQVVEHTARDVAYPVVADPTYWWGGKTWIPANKVSISQTASILYALIPGFVGPVALYNVGLGLCNQTGKGIWVYWTWAGHIWCTGP
ncbi:hypothetical protein [Microbacterium sp. As-52]|uniref:hypothetical protein n=1 Tax=Microbacterium sp. As-52 TaxID=3390503 RepID=UPI003CF5CE17